MNHAPTEEKSISIKRQIKSIQKLNPKNGDRPRFNIFFSHLYKIKGGLDKSSPYRIWIMSPAVPFYLHECGIEESSPYKKCPYRLGPYLGLMEIFPVFLLCLKNWNQFSQGNS